MMILLFLLLLVPSAWAEVRVQPEIIRCGVLPGGTVVDCTGDSQDQANAGMLDDLRCLHKMEAAMRAMDESIPRLMMNGKYERIVPGVRSHYEANLKLWNDAKACWRTR